MTPERSVWGLIVFFGDKAGGELQVLLQRVTPLFNTLEVERVWFEQTARGRWHMHAWCIVKPSVRDLSAMQDFPWWADMRCAVLARRRA